ncbi:MAG: CapA family protein [Firmicutes bacterium]|nr:CapA family protein [Bacillota bacterium]
MAKQDVTLFFGGDTSLSTPDENFFKSVDTVLNNSDIRMTQLENAFMDGVTDPGLMHRDNKCIAPLIGRFELVTLSGNHFYDYKEKGVKDTLDWCHRNNIACCGGGMNIEEAVKPAFVEKCGVKVGVLAYNVIGPKSSFAGEDKAGTAFVDFHRAYIPLDELQEKYPRLEHDTWQMKEPVQLDKECMGFNYLDDESCMKMAGEVADAKKQCDVLLVYFHKGYVHRPVTVAPFERVVSHIAIDNGADAVVSSHSHIMHGIEVYKGKAIYHGLNNFVMCVPMLSPNYKGKITTDKDRDDWVKNRVKRFGFVPDPDYPTYPFHPESIYTAAAKFVIRDKKIVSNRAILIKVEKDGVPYVHGNTKTGNEVLDYLKKITEGAGLNAKYEWDGDEIVIS